MFADTIRSFLLLQIALMAVPLSKFLFDGHSKRFVALRMGVLACMLGIVFCDARLLPEILGVVLVLINFLLLIKEIPDFSTRRFVWLRMVLYLSLTVFASFFVFRFRVLDMREGKGCTPLIAISKDVGGCGFETVDGAIPMEEAEIMVKKAYEHLYGEGSYEKAQIEKRETDSAYMFSSARSEGTNYVFTVMKQDGKRVSFEKCGHPNGAQDEK